MNSETFTRPESLPGFTEQLKSQIEQLVHTSTDRNAPISQREWDELLRYLLDFKGSNDDWEGFLEKGQIDELVLVQKKALKLLEQMDRVKRRGLTWGLDLENSKYSVEEFAEHLKSLAEMSPKSPFEADRLRGDKGWARHQNELRGMLQVKLDIWWERVSGTKPTVEEKPSAKKKPENDQSCHLRVFFR